MPEDTKQPPQSSQEPPSQQPQQLASSGQPSDLQAEIQKALEAERARWREQLKETLGVDSLDAWKERRLKEEGKLQELLQQKEQEAARYRQQFEQLAVRSAILSASQHAVDPEVIYALLGPRAKVGADGEVTIGGQPVAKAVEELLRAKPYLAKPSGNQGSGAPARPGKPQMPRSQFEALSPEERMRFIRDGGQVID